MTQTSKWLLGAIFAALSIGSTVAHAVPLKGLYSVKAEVPDQSSESRRAALPGMLQTVVGRLLGEPDAEQLLARWPELRPEFRQAQRYLSTFLYQRVAAVEGESAGLLLRAEFEPAVLNQLIQRLQLPQWGADRPEVLVLIAWQGDNRREVLASSANSQIAAEMTAELEGVAADAGLPVALPLMDLQDRRLIPEQELRAGFSDGLLKVAARYGADAVLLGRLKVLKAEPIAPVVAADGEVFERTQRFSQRSAEVVWSLHQKGHSTRYVDNAGSVRSAMQSGVWMATRSLAERYAVQGGAADPLLGSVADTAMVNVLAVNSLYDLKRVEKHLAERTVVSRVALKETSQLQGELLAVFELKLQSSLEKLEQALAIGRLLAPTSAPMQEPNVASSEAPEADFAPQPANPAFVKGDEPVIPILWYRLR